MASLTLLNNKKNILLGKWLQIIVKDHINLQSMKREQNFIIHTFLEGKVLV